MKSELYRLLIVFLLSIFLIFCMLKFLYIDRHDPTFWEIYLENWVESVKDGGVHF